MMIIVIMIGHAILILIVLSIIRNMLEIMTTSEGFSIPANAEMKNAKTNRVVKKKSPNWTAHLVGDVLETQASNQKLFWCLSLDELCRRARASGFHQTIDCTNTPVLL